MSSPRQAQHLNPRLPWWRVGTAWFAVLSLGTVVAGSITMAVVAVHGADPVLAEGRQRIGPGDAPRAETPAQLARNHAAAAGTVAPVPSSAQR